MFALVGFGELVDRYELEVQIRAQKLHQKEYGSVSHYVGGEFLSACGRRFILVFVPFTMYSRN